MKKIGRGESYGLANSKSFDKTGPRNLRGGGGGGRHELQKEKVKKEKTQ